MKEFEVGIIANLMPETAEEAYTLVPSLRDPERYPNDDDLQVMTFQGESRRGRANPSIQTPPIGAGAINTQCYQYISSLLFIFLCSAVACLSPGCDPDISLSADLFHEPYVLSP